jgi:hypothetical protein
MPLAIKKKPWTYLYIGSSLIRKWSRDNVTVNTLDFAAFVMERVCLKDNVHLKLVQERM